MIVLRHMEVLLNLSPVPGEHDLRGLHRLYNEVETNVRSLKALAVEQDSYGTVLTSVLLTKLPLEVKLIITRTTSKKNLDLKTLQTILEEELIARERSHDPIHPPTGQALAAPTATTLLSGAQESSQKPLACCYCQQSHSAVDCHVTDLDARRQILKSCGRCFNCLVRGHVKRRCRSSPQCQTCRRKHCPSINFCDQTTATDPRSPPSTVEPTNVSISTLNPEATPYVSNPTTNVLCSTSTKSILLQTARALAYNPWVPDSRIEL